MSAKPILYYMDISPPSQTVMLVAEHLGLELDLKVVNIFAGENKSPEFLKMNPQHTIPLLDDNGTLIYDSHAICGYLVQKHAGQPGDKHNGLYPLQDLARRAQIDARQHFDSGVLFAKMRFLFEGIVYRGEKQLDQDRLASLTKSLETLEQFLADGRYVVGDELSLADFSCMTTISAFDGFVDLNEKDHPRILAWRSRMKEFAFYERITTKPSRALQALLREKLKAE